MTSSPDVACHFQGCLVGVDCSESWFLENSVDGPHKEIHRAMRSGRPHYDFLMRLDHEDPKYLAYLKSFWSEVHYEWVLHLRAVHHDRYQPWDDWRARFDPIPYDEWQHDAATESN